MKDKSSSENTLELNNKDNDYLPMNNSELSNDDFEEIRKNPFCSRSKICVFIFMIISTILFICLIILVPNKNKENKPYKEDKEDQEDKEDRGEKIIYSFHLKYISELDNQTVELYLIKIMATFLNI